MVTTAGMGTFTYAPFRLPLLPTAPALAPAAGASPGGLEGELAGPDPPGPGDAGVQETPEVASCMTRGRGAWGGSVYDGYRLVPGSSRPAGVVTQSRGLARGARELDSTSIVRPSACRGHAAGRPAEAMSPMEGGGRGVKPRPRRLTSGITLLGPTRLSEQTRPPRTE